MIHQPEERYETINFHGARFKKNDKTTIRTIYNIYIYIGDHIYIYLHMIICNYTSKNKYNIQSYSTQLYIYINIFHLKKNSSLIKLRGIFGKCSPYHSAWGSGVAQTFPLGPMDGLLKLVSIDF